MFFPITQKKLLNISSAISLIQVLYMDQNFKLLNIFPLWGSLIIVTWQHTWVLDIPYTQLNTPSHLLHKFSFIIAYSLFDARHEKLPSEKKRSVIGEQACQNQVQLFLDPERFFDENYKNHWVLCNLVEFSIWTILEQLKSNKHVKNM